MFNFFRLSGMLILSLMLTSACANEAGDARNHSSVQETGDANRTDREFRRLNAVPGQTPAIYGQWGKLGMEEAKRAYPNANIVDYQHIGRRLNTTVEEFRYELQQNGRDMAVRAIITFDTQTNRIISVDLTEE